MKKIVEIDLDNKPQCSEFGRRKTTCYHCEDELCEFAGLQPIHEPNKVNDEKLSFKCPGLINRLADFIPTLERMVDPNNEHVPELVAKAKNDLVLLSKLGIYKLCHNINNRKTNDNYHHETGRPEDV